MSYEGEKVVLISMSERLERAAEMRLENKIARKKEKDKLPDFRKEMKKFLGTKYKSRYDTFCNG